MSGRKTGRTHLEPRRVWLIPLGLFAVTLAAYCNSFWAPFVFDDFQTIQRNAAVHFGELGFAFYPRALLFETFTLNSMWSKQEVWSYHVVNFVLHFLNGLLVFILTRRILENIPFPFGTRSASPIGRSLNGGQGEGLRHSTSLTYAALAAAFFLLHPIQTESVTYISSRSELLSTFFYLLGFLAFVLWPAERIGFACAIVVGITYLFGVGSKETAITLPAAIFLYDFLLLSKAKFRPLLSRWRFYVVYLVGASASIYYLLTVGLKEVVGSHVAGNLSSWHYFLTETRVLVRYIQLVFLPVGLNLDYDFRPSSSVFDPAVLFSLILLSGVVLLGWRLRVRAPVFAFSIFWFFLTLSPTSSVVPIIDVIFEHRLYLPLAGVAISFPLLVELLYRKVKKPKAAAELTTPALHFLRLRPIGLALRATPPLRGGEWGACVILAALLVATVARNSVWGDEVRLFADVVAKSPLKKRPYNALAFAYYKRGDYDNAAMVLQKGMKKIPNSEADLGDVLGTMYLKQGRYDKAIGLFEIEVQAVKGEQLAVSYNNLGMAYLYVWTDLQNRQNQMTAAEFDSKKEEVLKPAAESFSKSLAIAPDVASTLDNYINAMCWRGRGSELEAAAMARLQAKDQFDTAHLTPKQAVQEFSDLYTVGKVAFNSNDYAKADTYFTQAEKIKGDVKIVFFNHAYALTALKQDERAIEKYIQSIRVEPIFIEAHHNLGLIYMNRKEYAKAIESFTEVLRLEPNYVSAHLNLASIYAALGQKDLAREHLSTALAVSPGNQQAMAIAQQFGL